MWDNLPIVDDDRLFSAARHHHTDVHSEGQREMRSKQSASIATVIPLLLCASCMPTFDHDSRSMQYKEKSRGSKCR